MSHRSTRRRFLTQMSIAAAGTTLWNWPAMAFADQASGLQEGAGSPPKPVTNPRSSDGYASAPRPRVAAIITAFYLRSHAHVIMENFVQPYLFNGLVTDPGVDVVSMYVDQFPDRDISRDVAKQFGITLYPTIDAALCQGGDTLDVDAVLIIGEHGDYPTNEKGQKEYPRKRFFDEVVKVFKTSGRVAPVYNDKHLSHRWDEAKAMCDTAAAMQIPFMAGSSVPLAERRPPLEINPGDAITRAVSIHSGPLEAYGYHALEVMQSMVEFRRGGETGVAAVEYLKGDPLWQAAEAGLWSPAQAAAAMAAELGEGHALTKAFLNDGKTPAGHAFNIDGILVTYRDGLRGIALTGSRNSNTRWNFACDGDPADPNKPRATQFFSELWQNRCLFKALAHAIQTHFIEQQSPYPIERTLLATGVVAAAMDSAFEGKAIDTPHLDIAYQAVDFTRVREMGASWKILTPGTPEPKGMNPVGV